MPVDQLEAQLITGDGRFKVRAGNEGMYGLNDIAS